MHQEVLKSPAVNTNVQVHRAVTKILPVKKVWNSILFDGMLVDNTSKTSVVGFDAF